MKKHKGIGFTLESLLNEKGILDEFKLKAFQTKDEYLRKQFLKKANEQLKKICQDKNDRQEMEEEFKEWDITLLDGMEDD